jgi:hypothetical protein
LSLDPIAGRPRRDVEGPERHADEAVFGTRVECLRRPFIHIAELSTRLSAEQMSSRELTCSTETGWDVPLRPLVDRHIRTHGRQGAWPALPRAGRRPKGSSLDPIPGRKRSRAADDARSNATRSGIHKAHLAVFGPQGAREEASACRTGAGWGIEVCDIGRSDRRPQSRAPRAVSPERSSTAGCATRVPSPP